MMTKLLTPDYFTENTCLFKDNFLHEMPHDIQIAIMDKVKLMDEKEVSIMKKLDIIYWGHQSGNALYSLLADRLFYYKSYDDLSLWGFTYNILDTTIGYMPDNMYDVYKKYITDEVGLFDALSIYKKYNKHDFTINDDDKNDEDFSPDYIYEELMYPLVADKLNELFSDDEWDMISKFELYTKLCEMREDE